MLLFYFVLPGRESSTYICAAQGEPEYFPASTSKDEWLKVDEKVGESFQATTSDTFLSRKQKGRCRHERWSVVLSGL